MKVGTRFTPPRTINRTRSKDYRDGFDAGYKEGYAKALQSLRTRPSRKDVAKDGISD